MFPVLRLATLAALTKLSPLRNITSNFHILAPKIGCNLPFLAPSPPLFTQTCGFKAKGRLKKRCEQCYFVKRENRWFVLCKAHPRHKQMQIVMAPRNLWVLTHATQGKVRPW